jgi:hypothetical protein
MCPGLYRAGAEPVQGLLAGLTLLLAGTAPVVEGDEAGMREVLRITYLEKKSTTYHATVARMTFITNTSGTKTPTSIWPDSPSGGGLTWHPDFKG